MYNGKLGARSLFSNFTFVNNFTKNIDNASISMEKESRNRSGVAQRIPGGLGSQIS